MSVSTFSVDVSPVARRTERERIHWDALGRFSANEIIRFRHNLAGEPLLSLDSLRALAKRVHQKGLVRFKSADALFGTRASPESNRSIDQTFDRLEDPGSWLAIYFMGTDPAYAEFCRELMREIEVHIGDVDPGVYAPDLAIFLSAPPSETPYHIDQHPVFFFQLRGHKLMNLWDARDPEVVPPEVAEEFICTKREGLVQHSEAIRPKVIEFELTPGQGVCWPTVTPHYVRTQPHWAKPGDGISLSLSISYYTKASRRRLCVSALNRLMRNHSPLHPFPYGASPLRDRLKYPVGHAYLLARRLVTHRCLSPPQGL